jgi:hypothetical protein
MCHAGEARLPHPQFPDHFLCAKCHAGLEPEGWHDASKWRSKRKPGSDAFCRYCAGTWWETMGRIDSVEGEDVVDCDEPGCGHRFCLRCIESFFPADMLEGSATRAALVDCDGDWQCFVCRRLSAASLAAEAPAPRVLEAAAAEDPIEDADDEFTPVAAELEAEDEAAARRSSAGVSSSPFESKKARLEAGKAAGKAEKAARKEARRVEREKAAAAEEAVDKEARKEARRVEREKAAAAEEAVDTAAKAARKEARRVEREEAAAAAEEEALVEAVDKENTPPSPGKLPLGEPLAKAATLEPKGSVGAGGLAPRASAAGEAGAPPKKKKRLLGTSQCIVPADLM